MGLRYNTADASVSYDDSAVVQPAVTAHRCTDYDSGCLASGVLFKVFYSLFCLCGKKFLMEKVAACISSEG